MARILVLDGHSSAALAFTRSAGRAGHWVAVGANQGLFAVAKLSRYCQLPFDYPVSTSTAEAFVVAVREFARLNGIDVVVPITDWTVQPLSEQRESFAGISRLALPPRDAVTAAADKFHTVELARSLGIGVPRTWLIQSPAEIAGLPDSKNLLVIKDRFSVRWKNDQAIFGSVSYAMGKEEVERRIGERLRAAGEEP